MDLHHQCKPLDQLNLHEDLIHHLKRKLQPFKYPFILRPELFLTQFLLYLQLNNGTIQIPPIQSYFTVIIVWSYSTLEPWLISMDSTTPLTSLLTSFITFIASI